MGRLSEKIYTGVISDPEREGFMGFSIMFLIMIAAVVLVFFLFLIILGVVILLVMNHSKKNRE